MQIDSLQEMQFFQKIFWKLSGHADFLNFYHTTFVEFDPGLEAGPR